MAGSMRMDFDGAQKCKTGLDNGASAIDSAIKSLDSVIQQLEGVWEGDSSRRFCEDYHTNLKKALTTVYQAVDATAKDLQSDINRWQALDTNG